MEPEQSSSAPERARECRPGVLAFRQRHRLRPGHARCGSTEGRPSSASHSERGVTSIEYALIGAVVGVAFLASATIFGADLGQVYDFVTEQLATAVD